jgi:hypothetical protein
VMSQHEGVLRVGSSPFRCLPRRMFLHDFR